jgi:hypothetical protein
VNLQCITGVIINEPQFPKPVHEKASVRLLKQRSDSSCRQGESWDFDRRGIWVDHGCRADFQVGR